MAPELNEEPNQNVPKDYNGKITQTLYIFPFLDIMYTPLPDDRRQMRTSVSKSHVGSHVVTNVVPCVVPCGHMCGHIVVHQTCQTPKFMPCSVKYLLTMCIMHVSMLICINFVSCVY